MHSTRPLPSSSLTLRNTCRGWIIKSVMPFWAQLPPMILLGKGPSSVSAGSFPSCLAFPQILLVLLWQQLIGQSIHWDQLNPVHELKWRLCDSSSETQAVWPGVLFLCLAHLHAHIRWFVNAKFCLYNFLLLCAVCTCERITDNLDIVFMMLQCRRRNCTSLCGLSIKSPDCILSASLLP